MHVTLAIPRRIATMGAPRWVLPLMALLLVASALVAAYLRWWAPTTPAVQGTQVPVRTGTITQSVTTSGSTVSTRQAKLNFATSGRIRDVYVKLGDRVIAGQPIASLDTAPLEVKLDSARSAVRSAELKVQQLKEAATPEEIAAAQAAFGAAQAKYYEVAAGPEAADVQAAESQVSQAVATYQSAVAKLETLQAGSKPEDVAAARSQVDTAGENVKSAQAKLDLLIGGGTAADVTAAEAQVRTAQASLESANQKLADLLRGPDAADVRAAQSNLEAARASVRQAEAKVKADTQANPPATSAAIKADQAAVDSAEAKVKAAQADLDKAREGPKSGDIAAAQAALDTAQASLDSAKAKLIGLKVPNAQDVAQARAALESAKAGLRSAEAKLVAVLAPPTDTDVAAAQAAVDSASVGVTSAQAKLSQVRAGAKPSEIEAASSSIAAAQAQLASKTQGPKEADLALALEGVQAAELGVRQAQLDLDNAILTAPFDGVVAAINANPGEQASAGATNVNTQNVQLTALVTLVDPSEVRVDANVDEVDVAKLAVGKPAEVSFEAVPDRRFRGQVVAVSPSGSNQQGVVTYPVSINIQVPADVSLPAGLTASATILANQRQGVLVVPTRAIRRQGQNQTVDVLVNSKPESRNVRAGLSNDQLTEIVEGLADAEVVVVPGTSTAPVRTNPGGQPVFKPGGR